jgi:hypothetical protein
VGHKQVTWQSGASGNPNGRPPKAFAEELRKAVAVIDKVKKVRRLRLIAEKVAQLAVKGEQWAVCLVADRLDGKPATESTVNVNDNRDRMSDAELVAFIQAAVAGTLWASDGDAEPLDPEKLN